MGYKAQTENASKVSLPRRIVLTLLAALMVASITCVPLSSIMAQPAYASSDGMLVVAIDPGHGGGESGAYGNGVAEEAANWDISMACVNELRTYYGVKVVLTHDNSHVTSREDRINAAIKQGADVVVSLHCNSAGASAYGCEAWVPNTSAYLYDKCHVVGYNLADKILNKISALGIYKRGVYTRNCTDGETYPSPGGICDWYGINYWARWKGIPGIIIEHAFVSNSSDAAKLASSDWRKALGVADAQGIAEYYGLSKIKPVDTTANTGVVSTAIPAGVETDYAVMGSPLCGDKQSSVDKMVAYFNSAKKTYPSSVYSTKGAATINDFCTIMYEEGVAEGVRPEIAFCQSMKETGWLQFSGAVRAEQCNFAGLGAVDSNPTDANTFKDVRTGIRAQIQHLKAYSSTAPLNNACVDTRFSLVTRGSAVNLSNYGSGKWASDPNYGSALIDMVNSLRGKTEAPANVSVKMNLSGVPTDINTVYVDGVAQTLSRSGNTGTVTLPRTGSHSISMFKLNSASSDPHAVYPTASYNWIATHNGSNYEVTRYNAMDNLMQYGGSSIRITGNQGIRLITGINQNVKYSVVNTGVKGYKLVETGTLLAWSKNVSNGSLNMNTSGVSRGKAYVKNSKNPVFSVSNGIEQYTNVLVGFSLSQCKDDLTMRSYSILQNDAGDQIIVYGGPVQRSIGYIANQNANAFPKGSSSYNFVHSIINACK